MASLTARLLAMRLGTASLLAALTGMGGALTAMAAGAGAAGYAFGTLLNKIYEFVRGGQSFGSDLYDFFHMFDEGANSITRAATAEELAAARTARLAREAAAAGTAEDKYADSIRRRREAAEKAIEASTYQQSISDALRTALHAEGKEWDATTGKVGDWSEKTKFSVSEVNTAFGKLGLKGPEELKKIATEAEKAFNLIEKSGTATTGQLEEAWEKFAQAAVDSGDETIRAHARQAAAALGLGKQYNDMAANATAAGKAARDAAKSVQTALEALDASQAKSKAGKNMLDWADASNLATQASQQLSSKKPAEALNTIKKAVDILDESVKRGDTAAGIELVETRLRDLAKQAEKSLGQVAEVAKKANETQLADAATQAVDAVTEKFKKPITVTFDITAGAAAAGAAAADIIANAISTKLASMTFTVPVKAVVQVVSNTLTQDLSTEALKNGQRNP